MAYFAFIVSLTFFCSETQARPRDPCQKHTSGLTCLLHSRCEWIRLNGKKICVSKASQVKVKSNQLAHLSNSMQPPKDVCEPDSSVVSQELELAKTASPKKVIELLNETLPAVFSDFIEASPVLSQKGESDLRQSLARLCPVLKMYPEVAVHLTGVTYSTKKDRKEPIPKDVLEKTRSYEKSETLAALDIEKANLLELETSLKKTSDPIQIENYTASIEVVSEKIRTLERDIEIKFGKEKMYERVLRWAKELNYKLADPPTLGDEFYLLSMKRAQTIYERLKECGVSEKRLSFAGSKKGTRQKGSKSSPNRRVDLEYKLKNPDELTTSK